MNDGPALDPAIAQRLTHDAAGLVPAVIQDHEDGRVLMVGWMDDEALRRTLTEGRVTFWSRSRQEYWRKGDTSGNVQYVRSAALDCDGDTLLVEVDQIGPACHRGTATCFVGGELPVRVLGPDDRAPAADAAAPSAPAGAPTVPTAETAVENRPEEDTEG
ncbi:phosphoribosyl-AMP cyclohydrolase [Brachybacterium sp. MASK1Z-5]|uniref:Phosphoribosyl-AMP cyclohydrolase n=1 Tax=Brachybacterium halotolerans TaxID=2795215 RepID=A0ABS1B5J9_9MICO|nr:phosphoribosyl-AMP cyclohydrolase [Brachybacterium halotolerans]